VQEQNCKQRRLFHAPQPILRRIDSLIVSTTIALSGREDVSRFMVHLTRTRGATTQTAAALDGSADHAGGLARLRQMPGNKRTFRT